jgi:hypothetical protein
MDFIFGYAELTDKKKVKHVELCGTGDFIRNIKAGRSLIHGLAGGVTVEINRDFVAAETSQRLIHSEDITPSKPGGVMGGVKGGSKTLSSLARKKLQEVRDTPVVTGGLSARRRLNPHKSKKGSAGPGHSRVHSRRAS